MVASMGGMMGVLGVLRRVGLDRLLSGLDAATQNIVLRVVLVLLNYLGVVAVAALLGAHVDGNLLYSALVETAGASGLAHIIYNVNQKPPSFRYGVPPASDALATAPDPTLPSDPSGSAPAVAN